MTRGVADLIFAHLARIKLFLVAQSGCQPPQDGAVHPTERPLYHWLSLVARLLVVFHFRPLILCPSSILILDRVYQSHYLTLRSGGVWGGVASAAPEKEGCLEGYKPSKPPA